jgi:energy-coupling factor transporter ATP-binding protein EcfA2
LIELRDITFGYQETERPALSRVNISFAEGEFSLICGATGSGKSTLLRIMNGLSPHFTGGMLSGSLLIDGKDLTGSLPHDLASVVGFVNQQPESSFVSDTVEEELAFGMEQLGFQPKDIRKGIDRVSKMLEIEKLLDKPLSWLSGGQQQRVAIAAALAAGQKVLLLDEPTSALDPETAAEIIRVLKDLAHEHQVTVILVEHRIERVIDLVDSVVIVAADGLVTKGGLEQFENYNLVPPVIALSKQMNWTPLVTSIEEARKNWLASGKTIELEHLKPDTNEVALTISGLSVVYKNHVALSPISFEARKSEVVAVMGPNGSGKSSLLWAIQGSGVRTTGSASTLFGDPIDSDPEQRLCMLTLVPQRSADLLFLNTLADELAESDNFANVGLATTASIFEKLAGRLDPKIHPRDLSSGQQLALVLALQLVKEAGVVLLDEPTRGLDYQAKRNLAKQILKLKQEGKCILLASHDVEFVALVADRVLLLDKGELVSDESATTTLGSDSPLATQIAQITKQEGLIRLEQLFEVTNA